VIGRFLVGSGHQDHSKSTGGGSRLCGHEQRVNRGHTRMAEVAKKSETFLLGMSILMVFLRRLSGSIRLASAFSQH
jgi:hypothetical protein